jgi:hypothetical protein
MRLGLQVGCVGAVILGLFVPVVTGLPWLSQIPIGAAQGATDGWLAPLSAEAQREAIELQRRGFDVAMTEVSHRYTELYVGASEGNWDYALYMAEKLAVALQNGLERRPKRRMSAEGLFLQGVYPAMLEALRKQDRVLFEDRFDAMRAACNACHIAEDVPFIRVGVPTRQLTPLEHRVGHR